ncbi:hypothetical protein BX600DRAFT_530819 [Xylariales sp. PMI_506]|nr:hypothetical protein BX600DRAFT_530819 [Xylariales sp. PMI_506]
MAPFPPVCLPAGLVTTSPLMAVLEAKNRSKSCFQRPSKKTSGVCLPTCVVFARWLGGAKGALGVQPARSLTTRASGRRIRWTQHRASPWSPSAQPRCYHRGQTPRGRPTARTKRRQAELKKASSVGRNWTEDETGPIGKASADRPLASHWVGHRIQILNVAPSRAPWSSY